MILSEASLADLNTRLEKKVKMDQFRPNIVVTGCDAFEEVRGSPLLCIKLGCAVQGGPWTDVPFPQPQLRSAMGSGEGDSSLTWWGRALAAPGGRRSPFPSSLELGENVSLWLSDN